MLWSAMCLAASSILTSTMTVIPNKGLGVWGEDGENEGVGRETAASGQLLSNKHKHNTRKGLQKRNTKRNPTTDTWPLFHFHPHVLNRNATVNVQSGILTFALTTLLLHLHLSNFNCF